MQKLLNSTDDTNDVDTLDMDNSEEDDMNMDSDMGDDSMDMDSNDQESDDEEMDLEAIIRELEQTLEGEDSEEKEESMYEAEETVEETVEEAKDETEEKEATNEEAKEDNKEEMDEVIDLEEILREMEADLTNEAEEESKDDKEEELKEAYATIKSLQTTINEVNLLNAKLLFANKLFRAHNMTNEQKVKVIETLDRTKSVREVKLVYSTLAENFKYTSITKTAKKSITEGIASKAEVKQVIAESADFSDRFKKLAGIIK
jgi:DNA repair exonuclease SbcCD ATPase subunit